MLHLQISIYHFHKIYYFNTYLLFIYFSHRQNNYDLLVQWKYFIFFKMLTFFILQQSFFTPQACSENARRFSIENFCSRLTEIIDVTLDPYFNRDVRVLPATVFPTAGPRTAELRRLYLGDSNRPTQAGHGGARTYIGWGVRLWPNCVVHLDLQLL